jgi:hypothetical protein
MDRFRSGILFTEKRRFCLTRLVRCSDGKSSHSPPVRGPEVLGETDLAISQVKIALEALSEFDPDDCHTLRGDFLSRRSVATRSTNMHH